MKGLVTLEKIYAILEYDQVTGQVIARDISSEFIDAFKQAYLKYQAKNRTDKKKGRIGFQQAEFQLSLEYVESNQKIPIGYILVNEDEQALVIIEPEEVKKFKAVHTIASKLAPKKIKGELCQGNLKINSLTREA